MAASRRNTLKLLGAGVTYGVLSGDSGFAVTRAYAAAQSVDPVNVRSPPFNASGDASADDADAILAAAKKAAATGAALIIPGGTYVVGKTLMLAISDGLIVFQGDVTIRARKQGRFERLRAWGYEYADALNQRHRSDPEKYAPGQPHSIERAGFYPLAETVLWAIDGSDGTVHLGNVTFDCSNIEGLAAIANLDPSQQDANGKTLTGGHQVWQRISILNAHSYGLYAPPKPTSKSGREVGGGKGHFPKLLQATAIDVLEVRSSGGAITGFRNTTDGCSIRCLTAAATGFKSSAGNWIAPIYLNDTNLLLDYLHMYGKQRTDGAMDQDDGADSSTGSGDDSDEAIGSGDGNGRSRKRQQTVPPVETGSLEVDDIHLESGAFLYAQYAHFEGRARYACSCGEDAQLKVEYLKLGSGKKTASRYGAAILFEGARGSVEVTSVNRNIDRRVWSRIVDLSAHAGRTYGRIVRIHQPFGLLSREGDPTERTDYSMFPVAYTDDSDNPDPGDQILVESTEGTGIIARQGGTLRFRVLPSVRSRTVTATDSRYSFGVDSPPAIYLDPDASSGDVEVVADPRHKFLNGEEVEIQNIGKKHTVIFQAAEAVKIPPGTGQKFRIYRDNWSKI
jgi:hypothetical protein